VSETLRVDGVDVLIDGNGPRSIVMIHGWPDTHRLWDTTVQALQGHYRCVRFTLPGFEPGSPRRSHSGAELVATFKAIVEQACPGQRVTLLLHDWGCAFGYAFAAQHPELVAKIVGVDIGDAGSRAHLRALRLVDKLMIVAYQGWLAIAWRIGGRIGEWMTHWMARALHCPSDPVFIGSRMNYPYHRQWTGGGATPAAAAFVPACPMLYIYGTKKPFMFHSPAWAKALARRPGCQVLAFETGHWVMSRRPEPFNQALLAWLGRTPGHLA
jgi:pimeloyl-ACP methyl ester carboxylesterase